jgi:hypothetical protein
LLHFIVCGAIIIIIIIININYHQAIGQLSGWWDKSTLMIIVFKLFSGIYDSNVSDCRLQFRQLAGGSVVVKLSFSDANIEALPVFDIPHFVR